MTPGRTHEEEKIPEPSSRPIFDQRGDTYHPCPIDTDENHNECYFHHRHHVRKAESIGYYEGNCKSSSFVDSVGPECYEAGDGGGFVGIVEGASKCPVGNPQISAPPYWAGGLLGREPDLYLSVKAESIGPLR